LTNTLQFNLEGTHHFSQTDGQTPFQTGNLGKNYASTGNLTNTANWNYGSGQTKIPVNLASTNEAVNFLDTQHDLLDITNLAKRKSFRKYNPFAIKNRPSKYANVPIEVKKNKNLDNFLQEPSMNQTIRSIKHVGQKLDTIERSFTEEGESQKDILETPENEIPHTKMQEIVATDKLEGKNIFALAVKEMITINVIRADNFNNEDSKRMLDQLEKVSDQQLGFQYAKK